MKKSSTLSAGASLGSLFKTNISDLESELEEKVKVIAKLQGENQRIIELAQKEITELKSKSKKYKTLAREYKTQTEQLSHSLERLESENREIKSDVEFSGVEFQKFERENMEVKAELEHVRQMHQSKIEEIKDLKAKVKDEEINRRELESKVSKVHEEFKAKSPQIIRQREKKWEDEKFQMEEDIANKEETIKKLIVDVEIERKKKIELKKYSDSLRQDLDKLSIEVVQKEEEMLLNQSTKSVPSEFKDEVKKLNKLFNGVKTENNELNEEVNELLSFSSFLKTVSTAVIQNLEQSKEKGESDQKVMVDNIVNIQIDELKQHHEKVVEDLKRKHGEKVNEFTSQISSSNEDLKNEQKKSLKLSEEIKNMTEEFEAKKSEFVKKTQQYEELSGKYSLLEKEKSSLEGKMGTLKEASTAALEAMNYEETEQVVELKRDLEDAKKKMKELAEQIGPLKEQLEGEKKSNQNLRNKMKENEAALEARNNKIQELETEKMPRLQRDLEMQKQKNEKLRKGIPPLEEKLKKETEKAAELQARNESLTKDIKASKNNLERRGGVVARLESSLKDLKRETENLKRDNSRLVTQIDVLKQRSVTVQDEKRNQEELVGKLKKENDSLKRSLEMAKVKKEDKSVSDEKIQALEAEIQEQKLKSRKSLETILGNQQQIKSMSSSNEELQKQLRRKEEESEDLLREISGLKRKVEEKSASGGSVVVTKPDESSELKEKLDKSQAEVEKNVLQIERLKRDAAESKKKNDTLLEKIEGLKLEAAKIEDLNKKLGKKEEESHVHLREIEELKRKVDKESGESSQLNQKLKKSQDEVEKSLLEIRRLREEASVTKKKNEELKRTVEEKSAKGAESSQLLMQKLRKSQEEVEKNLLDIKRLREEASMTKKKNEELKRKVEEESGESSQLQQELKKSQDEAEKNLLDIKRLKEQVAIMKKKNEVLKRAVEEKSAKGDESSQLLLQKLRKSQEEVEKNLLDIKRLKEQVAMTKKKNNEINEKMEVMEMKMEATKIEIDKNAEQSNELELKNEELGRQVQKLKELYSKTKNNVSQLQKEKEDLQERVKLGDASSGNLDSKIKEYQLKIQKARKVGESQKSEISKLRNDFVSYKKKSEVQVMNLKKFVGKKEENLKKVNLEFQKIRLQNENLQKELTTINKMKHDNDQKNNKIIEEQKLKISKWMKGVELRNEELKRLKKSGSTSNEQSLRRIKEIEEHKEIIQKLKQLVREKSNENVILKKGSIEQKGMFDKQKKLNVKLNEDRKKILLNLENSQKLSNQLKVRCKKFEDALREGRQSSTSEVEKIKESLLKQTEKSKKLENLCYRYKEKVINSQKINANLKRRLEEMKKAKLESEGGNKKYQELKDVFEHTKLENTQLRREYQKLVERLPKNVLEMTVEEQMKEEEEMIKRKVETRMKERSEAMMKSYNELSKKMETRENELTKKSDGLEEENKKLDQEVKSMEKKLEEVQQSSMMKMDEKSRQIILRTEEEMKKMKLAQQDLNKKLKEMEEGTRKRNMLIKRQKQQVLDLKEKVKQKRVTSEPIKPVIVREQVEKKEEEAFEEIQVEHQDMEYSSRKVGKTRKLELRVHRHSSDLFELPDDETSETIPQMVRDTISSIHIYLKTESNKYKNKKGGRYKEMITICENEFKKLFHRVHVLTRKISNLEDPSNMYSLFIPERNRGKGDQTTISGFYSPYRGLFLIFLHEFFSLKRQCRERIFEEKYPHKMSQFIDTLTRAIRMYSELFKACIVCEDQNAKYPFTYSLKNVKFPESFRKHFFIKIGQHYPLKIRQIIQTNLHIYASQYDLMKISSPSKKKNREEGSSASNPVPRLASFFGMVQGLVPESRRAKKNIKLFQEATKMKDTGVWDFTDLPTVRPSIPSIKTSRPYQSSLPDPFPAARVRMTRKKKIEEEEEEMEGEEDNGELSHNRKKILSTLEVSTDQFGEYFNSFMEDYARMNITNSDLKLLLNYKIIAPFHLPYGPDEFNGVVILHLHSGERAQERYGRLVSKVTSSPVISVDYKKIITQNKDKKKKKKKKNWAPYKNDPETRKTLLECFDLYRKIVEEGVQWFGKKVKKVVVVGDGLGGNLAASLALVAVWDPRTSPSLGGLVLHYPSLQLGRDLKAMPSRFLSLIDPFLPVELLETKNSMLLPSSEKKGKKGKPKNANEQVPVNPLISPLFAPNQLLSNFPPTYVSVASIDPLFDEGVLFAKKVSRWSKEDVSLNVFDGMGHGFLNFSGVVADSSREVMNVSRWLKERVILKK